MQIYIFILILLVVEIVIVHSIKPTTIKITTIDKKSNINTAIRNMFLVIDVIFLIGISAYRDITIGTDYNNYLYLFSKLKRFSLSQIIQYSEINNIEVLFAFFEKIFYSILEKEHMFAFVTSIIIVIGVLYFICKYSKDKILSIFLFLTFSMYNQSMNIIRQYVALVILLYSINLAREKKFYKYIIVILCAGLIHRTALIGIIIYPVVQYKKDISKICISMLGISFILTFFAKYFMSFMISLFGYEKYLASSGETGIGIFINLLILILFLVFKQNFSKLDEDYNLWLFMATMVVVLNLFLSQYSFVGRIMVYFKIAYIVSIPNWLNCFKNGLPKMIIYILLVLLFSLYYYSSVSGECYGTVPYTSDFLGIICK